MLRVATRRETPSTDGSSCTASDEADIQHDSKKDQQTFTGGRVEHSKGIKQSKYRL